MKVKEIIKVLTLVTLLVFNVTSIMNFERNIWMYWETDIETAPLVTKMSYDKISLAAKKQNWTIHLLNGSNIKNYLPDYDRFEQVVKNGYRKTVEQKSDILRVFIIEANGGVWFDFACIPFQDLGWLSNETQFEHLIINRIGSNKNDPDMLILGEGYHQSPLSYYNEDDVLVTDEYFGTAIHFFAAKRHSPIMTAWKQQFCRLSALNYEQYAPQTLTKRLYFHNIERDNMYYSGNLALQSVLQQKQMQFDNQLTLTSKRVNVYEHYKIWMFHGEVGPISMTRKHALNTIGLFMETRQEVESRTGRLWFYLKFAKHMRVDFEEKHNPTKQYFKKNPHLTLDQIITRGPTTQQCKLFYVVQGSIMHSFFNSSKYQQQMTTSFMTLPQRSLMKTHCQSVAHDMYFPSHQAKSEGQLVKVERELLHNQAHSIKEKVKVWWMANRLVVEGWYGWWRALGWMVGCYVIFRWVVTTGKRVGMCDKRPQYQVGSSSQTDIQVDGDKEPNQRKRLLRSIWLSLLQGVGTLLLLTLVTCSLQFYQQFIDMGKYPQYQCTLLAITTIISTQYLLTSLSKLTSSSSFFSLNKLLKDLQFALYLPLAFCIFLHFDIVYGYAFYHAIVVGGGGMLLGGVLEAMERGNVGSRGFVGVRKVLGMVKWVVVGVFGLLYLVPNLRYVRCNDRYVKQYVSEIVLLIFWPVFLLTIAAILIHLTIKLFQTFKKNPIHSNPQYPHSTHHSRPTLLHLILTTITTLLTTFKSHLIYSSISQFPSHHNFMSYFLVIITIYTVCGVVMRVNMPDRMTFSLWMVIGVVVYAVVLNCLQVTYVAWGFEVVWWLRYQAERMARGVVAVALVAEWVSSDGNIEDRDNVLLLKGQKIQEFDEIQPIKKVDIDTRKYDQERQYARVQFS